MVQDNYYLLILINKILMRYLLLYIGILLIILFVNKNKKKGKIRFKNYTIPTFYRKNRGVISVPSVDDLNIIYNTFVPTNILPARDQGDCSVCWA